MPGPVSTLTLGGVDISAYVSEESGPVLRWGRGANFDGGSEAPGYLVAIVQNPDGRFSPLNSGSPIAAQLKFGQPVHLSAVHSAVTYHLFHGFVRRIVPREGFAEIHCQDALHSFSRKETDVVGSYSRSVKAFREAIFSDIGWTDLDLAGGNGGESMAGWTHADHHNVLSLLTELNRATGSAHFMRPDAAGADYKTLDRTTYQAATSVEDWVDTDLTNPFAEDLAASDYNDERLVNSQRVRAKPREKGNEEVLWQKARIVVNADTTEEYSVEFDDPATALSVAYETVAGFPSVTLEPSGRSALLTVVAGAGPSGADLRNVIIRGYPALEQENVTRNRKNASSINTYGLYQGDLIESEYIPNEAHASGLADYMLWRHKDVSILPGPRFVNRFPTQLAREIGDVVRITSAELRATLARFIIRGLETRVSEKGQRWDTTYLLEALPAALNLFTVGGSADQGVGGTAVLGY